MTFTTFTNGTLADANEVNANFNSTFTQAGLNFIRQNIDRAVAFSKGGIDGWCEAYIDATGRNNYVTDVSMVFDTNKFPAITSSTEPYVIIEATSITSIASFAMNNCTITKLETGKWLLRCTTGSDAVKRAQIYKTLYYGSNGSDPCITDYVTSLTALKVNPNNTAQAADIGKGAYVRKFTGVVPAASTAYVIDTFDNTTTNTTCSTWSICNPFQSWYIPKETIRNTAGAMTTSDEFGTDTSGDNVNNPADCKFEQTIGDSSGSLTTLILCVGTMTKGTPVLTGTATATVDTLTAYSTAFASSDFDLNEISIINHSIPTGTFSATISKSIGVPLFGEWETGADVKYKLTNATEDSGWLNCSNSPEVGSFTAFTSEPLYLSIQLKCKSSSPTGSYPSLLGFYVKEL